MIKDGRSVFVGLCLLLLSFVSSVAHSSQVSAAPTVDDAANVAVPSPTKNCYPQSEMAAIARDFPQFRNISGAEYCHDGSQTANLIESLMFMRKTRFENNMPNSSDELFSGRFARDWYGYFEGRITDINIQTSCPKGVGAYVYMWGSTMYTCPMLLSANFTALDRASVMMHEARHIDGFPHVTCRQGPRQGLQGACDGKIADGGSYAVSVETYAQIARYAPDVHPALRAYARSSAVTYADEAFDSPVKVDREAKFIIMTRDLGFHSVDPTRGFASQKLGQTPELGRIIMRAKHMVLFPENKSSNARYVFSENEGDIAQQAGDFAVEYNSSPVAERARLVDIHLSGQWSAKVYNDRVKFACDPRSEATSEVAVTGDVPQTLVYPTGYDRGATVVQLQMRSGKVFDLKCQGGRGQIAASAVTLDRVYKKLYRSGAETLGLGLDGGLYRVQNGRSTSITTPFDGQIFDLVPSQNFSFFENSPVVF